MRTSAQGAVADVYPPSPDPDRDPQPPPLAPAPLPGGADPDLPGLVPDPELPAPAPDPVPSLDAVRRAAPRRLGA